MDSKPTIKPPNGRKFLDKYNVNLLIDSLKKEDLDNCSIEINGKIIHADIILYIVKYLKPRDIYNLLRVSKTFYIICRSNDIWSRILFPHKDTALNFLYNMSKKSFRSREQFENYTDLEPYFWKRNNFKGYNYVNMLTEVGKIFSLMKAPYTHPMIKEFIQTSFNHTESEIHYTVCFKDTFSFDDINAYDYQLKENLPNADVIINFHIGTEQSSHEIITKILHLTKIIRPNNIPAKTIRKIFVSYPREAIRRLFMENTEENDG